jgi:hypothetical protein
MCILPILELIHIYLIFDCLHSHILVYYTLSAHPRHCRGIIYPPEILRRSIRALNITPPIRRSRILCIIRRTPLRRLIRHLFNILFMINTVYWAECPPPSYHVSRTTDNVIMHTLYSCRPLGLNTTTQLFHLTYTIAHTGRKRRL